MRFSVVEFKLAFGFWDLQHDLAAIFLIAWVIVDDFDLESDFAFFSGRAQNHAVADVALRVDDLRRLRFVDDETAFELRLPAAALVYPVVCYRQMVDVIV